MKSPIYLFNNQDSERLHWWKKTVIGLKKGAIRLWPDHANVSFDGGKRVFLTLILLSVLVGYMAFSDRLVTYGEGTSIPPEVTQYAKDWPLLNRDYSNTRFTADSKINSTNVVNLKLAWSFKIPGIGAYGGGASNPIIMGDDIYFQDLKANVFSLNLHNGHLNWEKIYNISAVVGPNGPAVGWGKVFVAKDLYTVAALNSTTGKEIWATKISDVVTTGIDIQPSVYDNKVYVSTVPGTADVFYAAGGIGVIYALDQATGNIAWSFSTIDTPDLWGHPEINSGGGCWYSPAIDVNTGTTYWGVSNPAPFPGVEGWPNGSSRPGPNLYTNSMVALYHNNGTMK
jgi:glucose dehydrogenase